MPLILQPDFGQTMLISLVWAALFFMAGLHWFWVVGLRRAAASAAALLAYQIRAACARAHPALSSIPAPVGGMADTFQVDTALESFMSGGWFGKGPGEGTIKRILPDAHTDFIFAVTGEEFGVLACIVIARALRLHRGARPVHGGAQRGSLLPFRGGGAGDAVRHAERRSTWRSTCI